AGERLRVEDAVAVSLERRPDRALLLGPSPAACLVRAHGERGERMLLERTDSVRERVGGHLWHGARLDDDGDSAAVRGPRRARDVRGLFGQQKDDHRRDLARLGKAPEGPPGADAREHLFTVALLFSEPARAEPGVRRGRARRDGVAADAVL